MEARHVGANILVFTAAESTAGTIATVIVAVSAATGALAWAMWRAVKSVERMERDARYLRRKLIWMGAIYVFAALFGIFEVVVGGQPVESLLGLPVALALAWFWLRAASRVKIPRAPNE